jgi:hypothetical protein
MNLTTHLHLMLKLRKSGAVPLLPICLVCMGMSLLVSCFLLSYIILVFALRIVLNGFLTVFVKGFFLRRLVSMYNIQTQVKIIFEQIPSGT